MAVETLSVSSMLPNKFEPKRKGRFILMIEGIDAFIVKTAARPTMSIEPIAINWMNMTRYVAGKTKFEAMNVTLMDPIAPSGAQQVMEWIRLHTETVSGRAGYADFYKRDIQLKIVDPVGTVIELWDMKGAQLTSVAFGELTYENQEAVDITISIQADNICLQF